MTVRVTPLRRAILEWVEAGAAAEAAAEEKPAKETKPAPDKEAKAGASA